MTHQANRSGRGFREFKAMSILSEDAEEQRESLTCARSCRSRRINGPPSHFSATTSSEG